MRREGSNILVSLDEWTAAGLSYNIYENDKKRGYLRTANCGGNGRTVEIVWDSIAKDERRRAIIGRFGDPAELCRASELERHVRDDAEARDFYMNYVLPDGDKLGLRDCATATRYYNNAIILAAAGRMFASIASCRRARGGAAAKGKIWDTVSAAVHADNVHLKYAHDLPVNPRRLAAKWAEFAQKGYGSLVHRAFGNRSARIVDDRLERLILSIYCMTTKPYSDWVQEDYMLFIDGKLDVVDVQTGEVFARADFYDEKKKKYKKISKSTCWRYINSPKNRAIVDSVRNGDVFHTAMAPHYHRVRPRYSFSLISMDDVDLPQLLHKGTRDSKGRACEHVKAYYAYDVASGALIGAAYSLNKNAELFIGCVREMFRFIDGGSFGVPLEVQVEHHIAGDFSATLLEAGRLFPFVQWCAPGNSQEKYAETFNRVKKYGAAKRLLENTGRHYARLEANRTGGERIWDEDAQGYVIKQVRRSCEEIVATDREVIEMYNNALHDNQDKYPGMSRLDVLRANVNPEVKPIDRAILARYAGRETKTSIDRNMYCSVQYQKYILSSPEVLQKLAANNYNVSAYWMPGDEIDRVYLYQNDRFIDAATKIRKFQSATSERTEDDRIAETEQARYIAQFERMVKEGRSALAKAELLKHSGKYETVAPEVVAAAPERESEPEIEYAYGDEEYNRAAAMEGF